MLHIIFWLATLGVWIDFIFILPWEGYEQQIATVTIPASRISSALELNKIPGFGRSATSTAFILGISSLFVITYTKSYFYKGSLFLITLSSLLILVSKSMVIAFFVAVIILVFNTNKLLVNVLVTLPIKGFMMR